MPGPWDSAGKRLLREMPQHVVTWLLKGATFVRTLPTELKSRNIFADGLYEIIVNRQPALMHIEFQSRQHKIMPERLLEYNVLTASENDWWPVYTFVIYLRKDGEVPQSPLIRRLRNGEEYQRFYYTVIEMANISARQLLQMGLHGLYPLILLAKGGTEPEVVREMVTDLTDARELELLALAYTFGGLAPGSEAYESWFRRSFAMLDDILEDSWTYQEIVKKGREKERHLRIRELREFVLNLVHMRFPDLITMTELHVETINDPEVLHTLLNKLFTVQTPDEAKQAIIDASTTETAE
jgi:hypothetical protein